MVHMHTHDYCKKRLHSFDYILETEARRLKQLKFGWMRDYCTHANTNEAYQLELKINNDRILHQHRISFSISSFGCHLTGDDQRLGDNLWTGHSSSTPKFHYICFYN